MPLDLPWFWTSGPQTEVSVALNYQPAASAPQVQAGTGREDGPLCRKPAALNADLLYYTWVQGLPQARLAGPRVRSRQKQVLFSTPCPSCPGSRLQWHLPSSKAKVRGHGLGLERVASHSLCLGLSGLGSEGPCSWEH